MNKPTIIITGASGFIGSEAAAYFGKQGWQVRCLVRKVTETSKKNITYWAYDMTAKPNPEIFKGADYLLHTAYIKAGQTKDDIYALNLQAARELLKLSRANKLKKNIFLSSMAAQPDSISIYGRQKHATEKLFNQGQDVVFRLGMVIGNGGLLKDTVNFIRTKKVLPVIDGGGQPIQVVGIYDLVSAFDKALTGRAGGRFTIANPQPHTYKSLYKDISTQLKLKLLLIPVPYVLPFMVIKTINLLHLPLKVTTDNLAGLKKLRYYDSSADLKKLGIKLDPLDRILNKVKL